MIALTTGNTQRVHVERACRKSATEMARANYPVRARPGRPSDDQANAPGGYIACRTVLSATTVR